IRFLRKNANWKRQYPLFSDILFCKEEYRVAIENYLEPVMNHYVVQQQEEAVQAIRLLNDASRGRANFFVLEAVEHLPVPKPTPAPNDQLIPALDIISIESQYLPLCRILLNNVYLLKSADEKEIESTLPP